MVIRDVCPPDQSPTFRHHGKPTHLYQDGGRPSGDCLEPYLIPDDTRALNARLLLERLLLRGIGCTVGVGLKWPLSFIINGFEAWPDHWPVQSFASHADVIIQCLEVEADELASFVQKTSNKQGIGWAMDTKTRQVMRFYIDDRSRKSARTWWANLLEAYRRHATFDTDLYVVYAGVMPAAQHRVISRVIASKSQE
jgi:IS1 family transposase